MAGYDAPELPDHMNGRIYDGLLGRFLSADLIVQAPASLQSFNRYSYVRNNPLTRFDPSGFADTATATLTIAAGASSSTGLGTVQTALAEGGPAVLAAELIIVGEHVALGVTVHAL